MQYHLDGYKTGSPDVKSQHAEIDAEDANIDVLIVGCGPAGLTLAAQLSAFPEIKTRIIEQKSGPLQVGQADGIACRSMEMFQAFGFAEKVAREAYWVNETTFWRPTDKKAGIARSGRIQDVEDGLSEFPHTILNQARVHDFFLEVMENSPRRLVPDYDCKLLDLKRDDGKAYPISATVEHAQKGHAPVSEHIRARFVVGCDGARSTVRKHLGYRLKGSSARQLWGVMDVLVSTDFPDIRLKSAIQSASHGSLLLIPREGGYMVRMYIELDALKEDERAADRALSSEALILKAQSIFAPFTLDVKDVVWWSAYEIGQRVCDTFDDLPETKDPDQIPRIFIAGDACHTHSPKAGQGMNVSMADAFNLGWKLATVILGTARPSLLSTYSIERQAKAKELIDFDREMAQTFSTAPKQGSDAALFQEYFAKHARYTAGVETQYDRSEIIGSDENQTLARGFEVGKRFHSAPVIRLADAKPLQLGHTNTADGRWRLILFGGANDQGFEGGHVSNTANFLRENPSSPVLLYTPPQANIDAVIDVRAVFQQNHRDLAFEKMPALLRPTKGRYGLTDYEKIFCADTKSGDIFDLRGIDRRQGAMVVIRPDQFVALVLPFDATDQLCAFFDKFRCFQTNLSAP